MAQFPVGVKIQASVCNSLTPFIEGASSRGQVSAPRIQALDVAGARHFRPLHRMLPDSLCIGHPRPRHKSYAADVWARGPTYPAFTYLTHIERRASVERNGVKAFCVICRSKRPVSVSRRPKPCTHVAQPFRFDGAPLACEPYVQLVGRLLNDGKVARYMHARRQIP